MADFQVLWTDAARLDLERIVEFIAEENPANALTVLARLERRCQTLAALPERGRIVPEARAVDVLTYRELIEGPWRLSIDTTSIGSMSWRSSTRAGSCPVNCLNGWFAEPRCMRIESGIVS